MRLLTSSLAVAITLTSLAGCNSTPTKPKVKIYDAAMVSARADKALFPPSLPNGKEYATQIAERIAAQTSRKLELAKKDQLVRLATACSPGVVNADVILDAVEPKVRNKASSWVPFSVTSMQEYGLKIRLDVRISRCDTGELIAIESHTSNDDDMIDAIRSAVEDVIETLEDNSARQSD